MVCVERGYVTDKVIRKRKKGQQGSAKWPLCGRILVVWKKLKLITKSLRDLDKYLRDTKKIPRDLAKILT